MTDVSPWEAAYQRFETPAQERQKFIRRLRGLGVDQWDRRSRILEICSGRGNGLVAWNQLGFPRVTGIDLSRALVERSACPRRCVVGDACRLPVLTASQHIAIVQGGLHHLPTLDAVRHAVSEMHRVLTPDGRVVIIEPWQTPFLRAVHAISEQPLMRMVSNTMDAFATMTEHEQPTYEAWLAQPRPIMAALTAHFEGLIVRHRFGKLVFLGRPLPRIGDSTP